MAPANRTLRLSTHSDTSGTQSSIESEPAVEQRLSQRGEFTVESFDPKQGPAHTLLTVIIHWCTPFTKEDAEEVDIRLRVDEKHVLGNAVMVETDCIQLKAIIPSSTAAGHTGCLPLTVNVFRSGDLIDFCNFGKFDLEYSIEEPTTPTKQKRKRSQDEQHEHPLEASLSPTPSRHKKLKINTAAIYLILRGDVGSMGKLDGWSPTETELRRRFVEISREQDRNKVMLTFRTVSSHEFAEHTDHRNIINCLMPPGAQQGYVTSVDVIKALEFLINPESGRLGVDEKTRIRRNIDTFHPFTIKKNAPAHASTFDWITKLGHPRPVTMAKDVRIYPWTSLEQALMKIMSKYSYFDQSIAANPPTPTSTSRPVTPSTHADVFSPPWLSPGLWDRKLSSELLSAQGGPSPTSPKNLRLISRPSSSSSDRSSLESPLEDVFTSLPALGFTLPGAHELPHVSGHNEEGNMRSRSSYQSASSTSATSTSTVSATSTWPTSADSESSCGYPSTSSGEQDIYSSTPFAFTVVDADYAQYQDPMAGHHSELFNGVHDLDCFKNQNDLWDSPHDFSPQELTGPERDAHTAFIQSIFDPLAQHTPLNEATTNPCLVKDVMPEEEHNFEAGLVHYTSLFDDMIRDTTTSTSAGSGDVEKGHYVDTAQEHREVGPKIMDCRGNRSV